MSAFNRPCKVQELRTVDIDSARLRMKLVGAFGVNITSRDTYVSAGDDCCVVSYHAWSGNAEITSFLHRDGEPARKLETGVRTTYDKEKQETGIFQGVVKSVSSTLGKKIEGDIAMILGLDGNFGIISGDIDDQHHGWLFEMEPASAQ